MQRTKAGRVALQFTATRDFFLKRLLLCRRNVVQRSPIPKTIHPACPGPQPLCWPTGGGRPNGQLTSIRSPFSTGLGSFAVLDVPVGTLENHSRDALLLQGACGPALGGFGRCLIRSGSDSS